MCVGYNDVLDDPSMGWARYAHSMRVFVFNSGLFYMKPTQASVDLLDKVDYRLQTENGWDQALFNEVRKLACTQQGKRFRGQAGTHIVEDAPKPWARSDLPTSSQ